MDCLTAALARIALPHWCGSFGPSCRTGADTTPLLFLVTSLFLLLDNMYVVREGKAAASYMTMMRDHLPPDDEEWRRRMTFSYEDRSALTAAPWRGEHRWFRSDNVLPLERYRSREEWERICNIFWPRPG
jgi:hypothetical protein